MNLPTLLSDVSISFSSVPATLVGSTARGVLWQAAPQRFLLDFPDVARYLVEDGSSVTIDAAAGADSKTVARVFRMTPLAALLYQRGMLALHASAVCSDKGAVLLAGDSGAGKSALLAQLLQRGFTMLSDELAMLGLDNTGKPLVYSTFPEIALWPDSLDLLGITAPGNPFDSNRQCFTSQGLASTAKSLQAIHWLKVGKNSSVEIKGVSGAAGFKTVGSLTYNTHVADALLDRVSYMRLAAAISSSVRLHMVQRPRGGCTLDALADIIVKDL